MAVAGVIGLVAGEILNPWFPINKNLWTSSYVVFTAGFALVCLGICYWVLDIKQWRRGSTPLLVFGMNAIAAYVFAGIVAHWIIRVDLHVSDGRSVSWQELIYQRVFSGLSSPANASLLYAVVFVAVCWAAMWVLYRRGIFLKV